MILAKNPSTIFGLSLPSCEKSTFVGEATAPIWNLILLVNERSPRIPNELQEELRISNSILHFLGPFSPRRIPSNERTPPPQIELQNAQAESLFTPTDVMHDLVCSILDDICGIRKWGTEKVLCVEGQLSEISELGDNVEGLTAAFLFTEKVSRCA